MSEPNKEVIGRVVATESSPTTSTTLKFWIDDSVNARPFDVVRIAHIGRAPEESSSSYAMITDLEHLTDGAGFLSSYVSSDFGDVNVSPRSERIGTTIAHAEVMYNTSGIEMPLRDSAPVYWADADGVREALGLKGFKKPVPAGFMSMTNGEVVDINFESDFLIGPEGAHLNIAGISGLATKTSYAMFLLSALQQKFSDDVSIIIFNVKGRDLLSIDEDRDDLTDAIKRGWERCGLEARPFQDVTYFHPYGDDSRKHFTQSRVSQETLEAQIANGNAFNYFYNVEDGIGRLPLLFSDVDDPNYTMEDCCNAAMNFNVSKWGDLKDEVKVQTQPGHGGDITVQSWRKFSRLLHTRVNNGIFGERGQTKAAERRQKSIPEIIRSLAPGKVVVIDIEPLPDYLQCLVVGDVVQSVLDAKLGDFDGVEAQNLGKVVIFADELNKYAPKTATGGRTLTNTLLEVTERGRSLGTVLFGAEQFRSGVHDRVLGNCSTAAFGRTNPIETKKGQEYRMLSRPQLSSLMRLPKGTLMLQHPLFTASVIKAQFPEPAYKQP